MYVCMCVCVCVCVCQGAQVVYRVFIRPVLTRHQKDIDESLDDAQEVAHSSVCVCNSCYTIHDVCDI